jgi:L-ascorbate metabolism protein UlaG (beta-lactamase superfamily)
VLSVPLNQKKAAASPCLLTSTSRELAYKSSVVQAQLHILRSDAMATRVSWLGHACLLFESDGRHILVDPFLTNNPAAATTPDAVQADFILVSHGHADHLGDTIAIARRTGATVVSNYEISGWLQKQGLSKVHGQQHGGSHDFPFGRVKLTLAFHGSALPDGSYGGNPCGFLLSFKDGSKVYDAADTGLSGTCG